MCAPGETNLPTFSVEQSLYVKWLALRISAQSIISKVRILMLVIHFLMQNHLFGFRGHSKISNFITTS